MIKIFISYGHDDYAYLARKLRDRIDAVTEENGEKKFDVFLDDKLKEKLGKRWRFELGRQIENSDYMLCFISSHSVREESVCQDEIGYALESNITVIPVRVEDVRVPFGINDFQRVEWLNNPEGFEDRLKEILAVISVPPPAKNAAAEAEKEDRTPESEHLHKTCWYFINKGDAAYDAASTSEDYTNAKKKYITALEIARQGIEEEDSYSSRRAIGRSLQSMGDIADKEDNIQEAKKYYSEALEIRRQNAEDFPSYESRRDLSVSLSRMGDIAKKEDNIQEAKKYYSESTEIARQNAEDFPSYQSYRDLSVNLNRMGDIADKEDNIQEAKKYYSEALEIRRQNAEDFPSYQSYRDLSVSLNKMGDIADKEDNANEAKKYYSEMIEIDRQNAEDFPSYQSRRDLFVSYYKLSLSEKDDGNYAEAKEYCEKALSLAKQNLDAFPCNESRNDYDYTNNLLNIINIFL